MSAADPRDYEHEHAHGGMSRQAYEDDPKRLCFTLARYKHTAKLLEGFGHVLEVGCADGFGTRIVRQHVGALTAIDEDARSIEEAKLASSGQWPVNFVAQTLYAGPVAALSDYDAVYALDVIEHIHPDDDFLRAMASAAPVAVIGTPSKEAQKYASPMSKLGHVNCVLPGAIIEGAVVGALKSFYAGPAVEVVTVTGNRLSLTINHPVMTSQGWVAAGELRQGMKLFRNDFDVGAVNDNECPSAIEDVFALLARDTAPYSIAPTAEDLHGDARFVNGDVDVVFADRSLLRYFVFELADCRSKFEFVASDMRELLVAGLGAGKHRAERIPLPSTSFMGFGDELFLRSSRHPTIPYARRFGKSANWHVVSSQKRIDSGAVDPKFFGELMNRGAGKIAVDEVMRIRRFEYVGHVYDLQTVAGYHTANGLYISNCYSGPDLRARLREFWDQVFLFTMHDEILGTSYLPMAQYLLALCVGPR